MKTTEIELQAQVENVAPLIALLEREGEFKYERRQRDQYFTPAHRDFLSANPIEEWLRLRDADGVFTLNYKKWHLDGEGRGLYADEYETKIESLEIGEKILGALDAKPIIVVEKVRKAWNYKEYEVCLDSVKDLGDFVELEYIGSRDAADHKEIMDGMIAFLKELGCGTLTINHSGYPALLLGRKEKQEVI
jgi:adenylate cyclase, class 2